MTTWLLVALSLMGLSLVADAVGLYLVWRRFSDCNRVVSEVQRDLQSQLRTLPDQIRTQMNDDLAALKAAIIDFIDERASTRHGGLSSNEVMRQAARVSTEGDLSFDDTELVRWLSSHLSEVLESLPDAKLIIDLRHGSIQGEDRQESHMRWACGGQFLLALEGYEDRAGVLEKLVTLLESAAKVDVVKLLSVFLKSKSAKATEARMNAILRTARSTLDFLKTGRMSKVEAAAHSLSRLANAIVLGGSNFAEGLAWSTETGMILFELHAIGRHAAHDLDRFILDLPKTKVSSIGPGPAIERVLKLRSALHEFRETAYVAQLAMLAQLLGLHIFSLLDTSKVRIDGEVVAQLEYCEHLKKSTLNFAATVTRLLDKQALDAVFRGDLDDERQETQKTIDTLLADLAAVEGDATLAIARIRTGERVVITADALKL